MCLGRTVLYPCLYGGFDSSDSSNRLIPGSINSLTAACEVDYLGSRGDRFVPVPHREPSGDAVVHQERLLSVQCGAGQSRSTTERSAAKPFRKYPNRADCKCSDDAWLMGPRTGTSGLFHKFGLAEQPEVFGWSQTPMRQAMGCGLGPTLGAKEVPFLCLTEACFAMGETSRSARNSCS